MKHYAVSELYRKNAWKNYQKSIFFIRNSIIVKHFNILYWKIERTIFNQVCVCCIRFMLSFSSAWVISRQRAYWRGWFSMNIGYKVISKKVFSIHHALEIISFLDFTLFEILHTAPPCRGGARCNGYGSAWVFGDKKILIFTIMTTTFGIIMRNGSFHYVVCRATFHDARDFADKIIHLLLHAYMRFSHICLCLIFSSIITFLLRVIRQVRRTWEKVASISGHCLFSL